MEEERKTVEEERGAVKERKTVEEERKAVEEREAVEEETHSNKICSLPF